MDFPINPFNKKKDLERLIERNKLKNNKKIRNKINKIIREEQIQRLLNGDYTPNYTMETASMTKSIMTPLHLEDFNEENNVEFESFSYDGNNNVENSE